ncbi:MAG: methyl-accepting chemotaxis protein [Pseudomonadota bacterium]|nr:methyl-accepting chemotaxis protein [Pseudomonadota bacterium]
MVKHGRVSGTYLESHHAARRAASATAKDASNTNAEFAGDLEQLRRMAFSAFTRLAWVASFCVGLLGLFTNYEVLFAAAASAAANGLVWLMSRSGRGEDRRRNAALILVASQPIIVLTALRLAGVEGLTPLAIFLSLLALSVLSDPRAIVGGAVLIAVEMLLLASFASGWLFIGGAFWREALYFAELLFVSAVAYALARHFERLIRDTQRVRANSIAQTELMQEQSSELELALHRVEIERQEREKLELAREEERKAQALLIAEEFEASITVVTQSVASTASLLAKTTKALNTIADDAGQSVSEFSRSAQAASDAAKTVARGVTELSVSISSVADNVNQQHLLTSQATDRSNSGGKAVGDLSVHSDTIEEATRAIVRIADRTNLLSLNAAIEAATAGPAGRGFTVVAQEVKGLAGQASEAATEIDQFLKGVRTGTIEAERSFEEIDSVIKDLAKAADAILWDVESQRRSADTIEEYARTAAEDVSAMAKRSAHLADTASQSKELSRQLDNAANTMARNVQELEQSTAHFIANLRAG